MKHVCVAVGCEEGVTPPRAFCSAHWKLVPIDLRRRVESLYAGGQKTPEPKTYLAVLKVAVEAVAKKEGRTT